MDFIPSVVEHMLCRSFITTCCADHSSSNAVQIIYHHTLYRSFIITCCADHSSPHAVQIIHHQMLCRSFIITRCTDLSSSHVVQIIHHHMLYRSFIITCCASGLHLASLDVDSHPTCRLINVQEHKTKANNWTANDSKKYLKMFSSNHISSAHTTIMCVEHKHV